MTDRAKAACHDASTTRPEPIFRYEMFGISLFDQLSGNLHTLAPLGRDLVEASHPQVGGSLGVLEVADQHLDVLVAELLD